ncbi:MAG: RDD family protein [Alphaproteobacteria bacterium]|nr:RDD family protein [Alphaproteobacteria bacterium]
MSAEPKDIRPLITPEGVDLRVRLAQSSERAGALLIDLTIIAITLVLMTIVILAFAGVLGAGDMQGQLAMIIWLLGFFVLRNFYFTIFESSPRAATPGKRLMKLRIASRDGGALRVEQIITRNAMREIELYMPMSFLFSQGEAINAVIILCGVVWCAIFVLFPLFNRDHLRVGDIVAGTWVLKAPQQVLLPDIAAAAATIAAEFEFTDAELDTYGVKELQVLEGVLRNNDRAAIETVAISIRRKLKRRKAPREDDHEFLNAYYAAVRKRLEQRMLFGVRKADKFDAR